MKRICLATLLLLLYCSGTYAQDDEAKPYKLLWEIQGPHSPQPSYLFGTMHVTDERAFQMPDSVLLGIQNTAGFALEVDFDSASYLFLEYLYAAHGGAIFEKETWEQRERVTKSWDGEGKPDFDPSQAFRVFERETGHRDEATFLDAFLYRLARTQGKTICGLEGIVEQLQLIAEPDHGYGELPAEEAVKDTAAVATPSTRKKRVRMSEMIVYYEKGDLDALHQMVNQGGTSQFFKNEVIIKRNYGMAARADSLMRLRSTFIGVGAAHLLGDEGVIALLRARGYKARPVGATYTGMAAAARAAVYEPHWTTFQRAVDGYRLQVPARPFAIDILQGKVKMYLGMDFPGGLVYCFYALHLPGELTPDKIESVSQSMATSMGKVYMSGEETADITYKGLPGKEFRVKKGDEHLRIRLLFDKDKMYMLLLGNSPLVTESKAANDWFNSLEFFEPQAILQQPRRTVRDVVNGFSMEIPDDFDYETHQVGGFPTGNDEPLYNKYEIEDDAHTQVLRILCEDFKGPRASGDLGDLLVECIHFMTGEDLEPLGEIDSLLTDGVTGLSATYQHENLRYRLHCYIRHNRLYLFAIGMKDDDADSLAAEALLQSVHFLPFKPQALTFQQSKAGIFQASLPGKTVNWEVEELPAEYVGRIDSVYMYYYHDPVTSFNATVEVARVWQYYGGSNAELYQVVADAKGYDRGDSLPQWIDPRFNVKPAPLSADHPASQRFARYYRDSIKNLRSSTYCIPIGDRLLIGKIQTPLTLEGDALSRQFADSLQSRAAVPGTPMRLPMFAQILRDTASTDSVEARYAEVALRYYRLQPSEYETAITAFKRMQTNAPFGNDEKVLDLLLAVDDSTILPQLQQLYLKLPADSPQRIEMLEEMMMRPWGDAESWAVGQLRMDQTPLDHVPFFFSWESYLAGDSLGTRLQNLAFLLDLPRLGMELASAAAAVSRDYGYDYSSYNAQFSKILGAAIPFRDFSEDAYLTDIQLHTLLDYLANADAPGWEAQCHEILKFDDGYILGSALQLLLEHGRRPSTKEVKHALEVRHSRDFALSYYLEAGIGSSLPAKYRKPDFIAAVALDIALEDYPEQVELIEKRKITWEGESQWLYIYRFAYEGDRDWALGFSGPIPQNGLPASAYLPLSGSEYDTYSPTTYKRKTKAWIRAATDSEQ
jgi:uncharacterized protein YbaP (TraB family)